MRVVYRGRKFRDYVSSNIHHDVTPVSSHSYSIQDGWLAPYSPHVLTKSTKSLLRQSIQIRNYNTLASCHFSFYLYIKHTFPHSWVLPHTFLSLRESTLNISSVPETTTYQYIPFSPGRNTVDMEHRGMEE